MTKTAVTHIGRHSAKPDLQFGFLAHPPTEVIALVPDRRTVTDYLRAQPFYFSYPLRRTLLLVGRFCIPKLSKFKTIILIIHEFRPASALRSTAVRGRNDLQTNREGEDLWNAARNIRGPNDTSFGMILPICVGP